MHICDLDITSSTFGLLTAIEKRTPYKWYCKCACGGDTVTSIYKLLSGHTKSCGCTREINFKFETHKMSKTRLYQCYHSMIKRCKNDKTYIQKGIKVCDEWSKILDIPRQTLYMRYYKGWDEDKILNTNIRKKDG